MIGVAWTVAHGPESSPGATARTLAGTMTRNCFGFASFLGIYSFVSCTTERIRQRDDVFNYIVGGASAGAFAAIESPALRDVAKASLVTGVICGLFYFLFRPPPRDDFSRHVDL
eukprot:CAMPEP_0118907998 /NCGR_PEP_ID=MMETSP1166-20130328/11202_1 /TAXON_ID=1104430 /ORGANISM="Chrysoreinhardia sp, Strain CCMP3193" /LENGTH=113 /DNA_ID=CAMNT_0006847379 /DNA_START=108 /DNA_END=449 /DNA_ORIENTATION=-